MHRARMMVVAACIAVSTAAMAQDTRNAELATSDQQLNATYRALSRQLRPDDQTALRRAQKAWIAFRDADCALGFADRRDCLMQRTDEREKQLRDSVFFNAKGDVIQLPAPRD